MPPAEVPRLAMSAGRSAPLAVVSGLLQAASLAWPFDLGGFGPARGQPLWWLQVLALAVLAALLERSRTPRQAAWHGWLFGLGWLGASFGWLYISMHTYGGLAAPLALLAVLVLAGVLGLYYALAAWAWRRWRPQRALPAALLFAALWLLAELARGQLATGFGWGAIGYAALDGPLQPLIPWVGVYGVGALAAGLAAALARLVLAASRPGGARRALPGVLPLGVALALASAAAAPAGRDTGSLSVTLLQGNIPQEEKFEPGTGIPLALRWYRAQLEASTSALVITPETAVPLLPQQLPEGYWQDLQQRFAHGDQAALVGVPLGDLAQGYTNSVVGFKPGQAGPWRYDKHHLVPFGEFIPPMFRWFTELMSIPLGDFDRGPLPQPGFEWQGQRLAATICYENLFSNEVAAQFRDPARAPTILVNVSNLGWFGEHQAMEQHLQIARMRSLEFDRPFLLATNTGLTAIVDHRGRVLQRAPAHQAVALTGSVQGRASLTPYAAWAARWGLWPLALVALGVVLAAAAAARRRPVRAP